MRKNKGLFILLLVSVFSFLALVVFLQMESDINQSSGKNTEEQQKEYFLPIVSTKRVSISYGEEVTPEMFIQSVESVYEVSYSFEKAPDLSKYGVQDVIVLVTDAAGNSAAVKTRLNIINLKECLKVNLGDPLPTAEDFLVEAGSSILFVTDISGIDTNKAGSYSLFMLVDGEYFQTILSIDDYEAPKVITQNAEGWLNYPMPVESFVAMADDSSTNVVLQYKTEPDWTLAGEQQVTFLASDENGNTAEYTAVVSLKEDTQAPVVSAGNIDVTVGGIVSYRNAVTYLDNASSAEELELQIDASQVNLNEPGCYDVTYTVTDAAGNSTSVVAKVNVVEEAPLWNDEKVLREKAEKLLQNILLEDMSAYEKAKAIFDWVNQNIRFINFSEKDNYVRGAYEGLFFQEGDCFVYAATSKYLLTLAGVQNLDIKKSSKNPAHYWNLVCIDGEWYHFDACPNKEGIKIFLYTDAALEAFSASRGDSHVYDKSLYPEIK